MEVQEIPELVELYRKRAERLRRSSDLAAPWEVYPHFAYGSILWRMGNGKEVYTDWFAWLQGLTTERREDYRRRHPEPEPWIGTYDQVFAMFAAEPHSKSWDDYWDAEFQKNMTTSSSGSATVEKDHDGIRSTVTIELLVSGTNYGMRIPRHLAKDLDPLPECAAVYPTADRLYRACLAGAWEGIRDAARSFRDSCGCVTYTRLSGTRLPLNFTTGFGIAGSLALLRAVKRPERLPAYLARDMGSWRVVA